ncbi:hypothetical protein L9F63_017483 [Diploptera punctata]|uniref:DUF4776 domain-containing protein n=1 Tax=Diploptera punctata TaxID=6984 RepID=A0AAD7ZYR7_DIPPU|nr:hypothetical protein L9F63_017483 [Diploptera punctata]
MELIKSIKRCPLHMTLMRKRPGTCPPEILGSTDVFLTSDMCKAIKKAMISTDETPIPSILQDSYNLRNEKQEDIGFISVFIRLSCFGQSIVTQFKLVNETNSFLFKNSKEVASFECENCECGTDDQPCSSGEQRPKSGQSKAASCGCTSDEYTSEADLRRPTYNKKDCGSETCENRIVDYVEIPRPIPEPCERSGKMTCCNTCGNSSPKDCGPLYPCGMCGESRRLKSSDCGPMYPCGNCGNKSQPIPRDCGPTYPCRVCGNILNKPKDCGPTYPCGECGRKVEKKSVDCGPAYPCGVCDSSSQNKPEDCEPTYPCGACSSKSKKRLKDCGPSYPCGACGTIKSSCSQNASQEKQICRKCIQKRPNPSREPLIYCDECGITPASKCPGEQEFSGLPCCECGDTIDESENNYVDNICDICSQCLDVLRPPFSERAEDDVVPVMPQTCSQHNIYDPEIDKNICPAKVKEKSEEWQEMLTCKCDNEHITELYDKLQKEGAEKHRNPPVRYDTTGCLSPAFGGKYEPEELAIYPNIRYDTTGALSAAHNHPPVRYDTTGALSSAYKGGDPTLIYDKSGIGYPQVYESASSPGMVQSTAIDPAFQGSGMEKQSYSEALVAVMAKRKKRRKCWRPPPKNRKKYVYTWGGTYPGMKIGHRFCVDQLGLVPARMGWSWDNPIGLKFRPGWRPGAINRKVISIMRSVKRAAGLKLRPLAKKHRKSLGEGSTDEKPQLPPTLHVHRRDGAYYISMHPMNLVPEENNVPLQFRIPSKKKDEDGDTCTCNDSDSSSDLEVEFMAPGVYWSSEKDKKTACTQCFECEFPPDPEQQLMMELQARSKAVPEKNKNAKKGNKGKGVNDNHGSPDPDTSPRVVGWDRDDQPTAVSKKKFKTK